MTLIERLREAAETCEATGQPTNAALFREAARALVKQAKAPK